MELAQQKTLMELAQQQMEIGKKKRRREAELEGELLKLCIEEKTANSSRADPSVCPSIESFTYGDTKEASVKSWVKEAQKHIVKPTFLGKTFHETPKGKSSPIPTL